MRLFSTDIDGTIFDGPQSAELFAETWRSMLERPDRPLLVYNTGRSLEDARQLVASTELPEPDYLICGVGTEIFQPAEGRLLEAWHDQLRLEWDFNTVWETVARMIPARPQPPDCQNSHKCSWFWLDADPTVIREVVQSLDEDGIKAQAIYSSNRDLDFLPIRANKGNAVAWLSGILGLTGHDIVVAGDSGNDASMYYVVGARGVLVANAESSLVEAVKHLEPFHASRPCAAGVREGLEHHLNDSNRRERMDAVS